jgi:hypothetical protein
MCCGVILQCEMKSIGNGAAAKGIVALEKREQ